MRTSAYRQSLRSLRHSPYKLCCCFHSSHISYVSACVRATAAAAANRLKAVMLAASVTRLPGYASHASTSVALALLAWARAPLGLPCMHACPFEAWSVTGIRVMNACQPLPGSTILAPYLCDSTTWRAGPGRIRRGVWPAGGEQGRRAAECGAAGQRAAERHDVAHAGRAGGGPPCVHA